MTHQQIQEEAIQQLRTELSQHMADNHLSFEDVRAGCNVSALVLGYFVKGRKKGAPLTRRKIRDYLNSKKNNGAVAQ